MKTIGVLGRGILSIDMFLVIILKLIDFQHWFDWSISSFGQYSQTNIAIFYKIQDVLVL